MSRDWNPEVPPERRRRILFEAIERGEQDLAEAEAAVADAERKIKPHRKRLDEASRRQSAVWMRLEEDRAELARMLTPDDRGKAVAKTPV